MKETGFRGTETKFQYPECSFENVTKHLNLQGSNLCKYVADK